jgi:hypothetical protein
VPGVSKWWRRAALAWALAPLLAACPAGTREAPAGAAPDAGPPVAVLGAATGDVRVKRADSDEWTPASGGMPLQAEDKIRTLAQSSATVTFESGSTLAISENSLLTIAGPASSGVRLEQGAVDVDWPRQPGAGRAPDADGGTQGDFVVETRAARARVSREIVFQ